MLTKIFHVGICPNMTLFIDRLISFLLFKIYFINDVVCLNPVVTRFYILPHLNSQHWKKLYGNFTMKSWQVFDWCCSQVFYKMYINCHFLATNITRKTVRVKVDQKLAKDREIKYYTYITNC